jgi:hypothetical protein
MQITRLRYTVGLVGGVPDIHRNAKRASERALVLVAVLRPTSCPQRRSIWKLANGSIMGQWDVGWAAARGGGG